MTKIRFFQACVAVSLLVHIAWFVVPAVGLRHSDEVMSLLSYDRFGAASWTGSPVVYISALMLRIAAAVGLFFLFLWGRLLLIASVSVNLALIPFLGISVYAPLDVFIGTLATLLDGALLAATFGDRISVVLQSDQ